MVHNLVSCVLLQFEKNKGGQCKDVDLKDEHMEDFNKMLKNQKQNVSSLVMDQETHMKNVNNSINDWVNSNENLASDKHKITFK